MRVKTKKLVLIGVLASVAMILSYIELLLPPIYSAVQGIKLGLANVAVIFALYSLDGKSAMLVSAIKVFLSALLFGSVTSFIYSFSGAVLSLAAMIPMKKSALFSPVGVSVAGAVMHNVGQVLCAIVLLGTAEIGYYLIFLSISAVLSGVLVGLVSALLIKKPGARPDNATPQ